MRPKNVQEHVNAMIIRTDYQFGSGGTEMAIRGMDGPVAGVNALYSDEREANAHESFLREILGKELARAETRGRAGAFREAVELLGRAHGVDRAVCEALHRLANEADMLDHVTVSIAEDVPVSERAEIVADREKDYGEGRVKVALFVDPRKAKKEQMFADEVAKQLEITPVTDAAMPPGKIALAQDGKIQVIGDVGEHDNDDSAFYGGSR